MTYRNSFPNSPTALKTIPFVFLTSVKKWRCIRSNDGRKNEVLRINLASQKSPNITIKADTNPLRTNIRNIAT